MDRSRAVGKSKRVMWIINNRMGTDMAYYRGSEYFVGILLIVVGALFLVGELVGFDIGDFFQDWWPGALILLGLAKLIGGRTDERGSGIFLLVLGSIFLSGTLGFIYWDTIWSLWPLILVYIGIKMMWRGNAVDAKIAEGKSSGDYVYVSTVLGSQVRRITSKNFMGGRISSLLGGIEIDLNDAALAEGANVLRCSTLFGAIELRIPDGMNVEIKGTPILGSIDDKRRSPGESASDSTKLVLNTSIMFGAMEILSS